MDKVYHLSLFLIVVCVSLVSSNRQTNLRIVHTDRFVPTDHIIFRRQASGSPSTPPAPSANETIVDNHRYYTSQVVNDPNGTYWTVLDAAKIHHLSSDAYLRFSWFYLPFNFPFYGHFIKKIALTTGGFLYMSSYFHPQIDLRHSRYIAPLMAHFETIGRGSDIVYQDLGDSFVAEWRNVHLYNEREKGNYTFQTRLFQNGTIVLAYKTIPSNDISTDKGAVKVGIADAYLYDRYNHSTRVLTRYIFRYHAVELGVDILTSGMAIIIHPLPTCNLASSCGNCTSLRIGFNCSWCNAINRCSDGVDRYHQDWRASGCDNSSLYSSSVCPSTTVPTTTKPTTTTPTTTTTKPTTTSTTTSPATTATIPISIVSTGNNPPYERSQKERKGNTAKIIVPVVVVLAVILIIIGAWIYYTRTHPNSSAGQWMIEHRPSQLKAKLSEKFSNISFSKDKSTGDKVQLGN